MKVAKDLIATRPSGAPVYVSGFCEKAEEINYICDGVEAHIKKGIPMEDIAILAHDKSELLAIGTELTNRGIVWVSMAPETYSENSRVIAAVSLTKALFDTKATACMLPFLNCREGGLLLQKSNQEVSAMIADIQQKLREIKVLPNPIAKSQYLDLLKNIELDDEIYKDFLNKLEYRSTIDDIYSYCEDFSTFGQNMAKRRDHSYKGVVLSTAHSSKGLEWPVVYVSISKFYNERTATKRSLVEESRRLLFVSATRARDELFVSGQYVAFGKKGDYTYNILLKNSYDAVGKEFCPTQALAEAEAIKKAKKAELEKSEASVA